MTRYAYRLHIGYTRGGLDRWRLYATLEEAQHAASAVFAETNIVLTIERNPRGNV